MEVTGMFYEAKKRMQFLCFGRILVLFLCLFFIATSASALEGILQDISFDPSYVWIKIEDGQMERASWVYGKTLFLDGKQESISPREFLQIYKNTFVSVGFEDGKVSMLLPIVK
jgi:hypothetical protein